MAKVGILVHCRNLETAAWEDLVYGRSQDDKFGDQAALAQTVLTLGANDELSCVVFGRGPSWRDGLDEGAYTKQFLLDHLDGLREFPRLKPLFEALSDEEFVAFRQKMEQIIVTREIKNTVDEVAAAAQIFTEHGVNKVIQIAAGSHAPRCIKEQLVARAHDLIDKSQQWCTVATDMTYQDTKPEDVCVIEPLHRPDQSMTQVRPGLSEVIVPYFSLPDDDKKEFITLVKDFMDSKK